MVDKPGYYWDHNQCAWVRFPATEPKVEIPEQQTPESRGVESSQEADVRSG